MLRLDGMEAVVYGRAILMVTANCIRKTEDSCRRGRGNVTEDVEGTFLTLRDRYRTEFPVRTVCRHCYNEIYNSVPLSLHDYGKSVLGERPAGIRVIFTTENASETMQVLECYKDYLKVPEEKRQVQFAYTKGHYKRGAE